jgi:leucyl/phenylalanyl-tRNA--protein transferase
MRQRKFEITYNTQFDQVIAHCKKIKRKGQNGTWITNDMQQAYNNLHQSGYAKSVEVWVNNELVGGLYGIDLGHIFCGESMFSKVSNASKIAFIYLVEMFKNKNYKVIDCQVYTDHLASLGAEEISREEFLKYL